MSIELISKVQPAGTNSVTISNIPSGYRELLVIGSYAGPDAATCKLEFGTGNASDYIYSSTLYANSTSTEGTSSSNGYGVYSTYYDANTTTAQVGLQLRPIIIRLQRYGTEISTNEAVGFTLLSGMTEYGNGGGAIEYHAGLCQNQSGTNFTSMRFRLTSSQNFASGTIFSLYGYL